jgi:hypothetical protein
VRGETLLHPSRFTPHPAGEAPATLSLNGEGKKGNPNSLAG